MRSPPRRESRRRALKVLGAGVAAGALAPVGALARPADVAYAIRKTLRGAEVAPGPVVLDLPDRSEQGTSVPLTVRVDSPMTVDDHVRAVHVFADANPRPHVLSAFFTPASGIAEVSTRIRLDGAQTIVAVAALSDGTHWRAERFIRIAFGACSSLIGGGDEPEFQPISRIGLPSTASKGETIPIRTLISHPMETGFRLDYNNRWVPLHIVEKMTCTFNGDEVFSARLHPAIATNPYLSFYCTVHESGTFHFTWLDNFGPEYTNSAEITVV